MKEIKVIYSQRHLIWTFAVTDLKLRYRNSVLGFLWSFLEPLAMLAVLYFVFSYIFPSKIQHYPLYLLLGIIIWNFFTRGTTNGMNSIQARAGLVLTVNFPRIILPISSTITSLLTMIFELGVFAFFMVIFGVIPTGTIILFPLLILFLVVLNLGISFPLSIWNVRYKDVSYIWQVVTYIGFFLSPIVYNLDIFPARARNILLINPMTQIINMSHDVLLYGIMPSIQDITYAVILCVTIFCLGFVIFQKKGINVSDDL